VKQEIKSKETQDLIINTSFELFYEKGYNATSIPDIMKKTSLSKGAFYHHFKNKHEIGKRVIEVILRKRIKEGFINPLNETHNGTVPDLLLEVFTKRIKTILKEKKPLDVQQTTLLVKLDILNKISELFLRHYLKNGEKP
jgi:AcrR family transcriptional regulator